MAAIDDDIDRLYQGPLDAFTDARNALAKSSKRNDIKTLAKPTLPAWAVNQLFWQHRAVIDRLEAAAAAVRDVHQQALAGRKADIAGAEQAHLAMVREAAALARQVLTAASQPLTPATLEAVRETLSALPALEAQGRLVKPLAPRGLEALAGLVLAARVPGPAAAPSARTVAAPVADAARLQAQQDQETAREAAAKEREAKRKKAEAALAEAREALTDADAAVEQAERDLATQQAARIAARDAVKKAQRLVEELSFGR